MHARYLVALTAAVGLLLSDRQPAVALPLIYSASIAPATQSFNGACPGFVHFTGTIKGEPGVGITYQFVGSGYANGAIQSDTLSDADGTLAVSENLPVNDANQGASFTRQLVVKAGLSSKSSNTATFSVTCTGIAPAPSSPPSSGGGGKFRIGTGIQGYHVSQLLYGIPIPENLKSTTDPHVCGDHGGFAGIFCIQAVPDNYLILVWDWQPNTRWPSIDGYRVYDVTGGGHALNQTVTNPQQTVEFFKPGTYTGKCYAVSAYKGGTESPLSASFCTATARIGTRSKGLPLFQYTNKQYEYHASTGFPGGCLIGFGPSDSPYIGWYHHTDGCHMNQYYRTYLLFDPSQIAGLNVRSARLKTRVSGDPSCFGAIGLPIADPYGTQAMINASWESVPTQISSTGAVFDVTSIVRQWANGATNWGFAFKSNNEDTGAEDNGSCSLNFRDAVLAIEYY